MAKYFGKIGFFVTEETRPGIYEEKIVERSYYGELLRNTSRRFESVGQKVNPDIAISNNISIVADPFANENFASIKYAEFMGTRWIVESVEIQYPRLILNLGGVYNGESD